MTMERALYQKLTAITEVSNRIYALRAPQNVTAPFIVYQRVSSDRWRSINGPSRMVQATMQIDVYAQKFSEVKDLALAVEQLLDGFRGEVAYGSDSPQDTLRFAGISLVNDVDILDQTDEPLLYRVSADYLVTYEQN